MQFIKSFDPKFVIFALSIFIGFSFIFNVNQAQAQRKDHLTNEEIELIRFHQEIDKRMEVYVNAIERRFLVLNGTGSLTPKELKRLKKDSNKWGELPKGSQEKILSDIDKILDEAINKIDDVAERDMKSDLFAKAVHILADGAKSFIPRLKTFNEKAQTTREKAVIISAVDYCNMIIEASSQVKKPSKKKKKKKKKKNS